jgi:hypothetical protein
LWFIQPAQQQVGVRLLFLTRIRLLLRCLQALCQLHQQLLRCGLLPLLLLTLLLCLRWHNTGHAHAPVGSNTSR